MASSFLPRDSDKGKSKKRGKRRPPWGEIIVLLLSLFFSLVGLLMYSNNLGWLGSGLLLGGITGGILLGYRGQGPSHPRIFGLAVIMELGVGLVIIRYFFSYLETSAYFWGWFWGLFGIGPFSMRLVRWLLNSR